MKNALSVKGSPTEVREFDWRRFAILGALVFAGIAIRVALVLWIGTSARSPLEELFATLALGWKETFDLSLGGASTAVVMPVYPLVLGIAAMVFPGTWIPVGLAQAFLGGTTAWLAYRISMRVFRNDRLGWTVLVLVAFYPPLVVASTRLDTLVLTGFLLALGIWLLTLNFEDVQHILFFMAAAVVFSLAILTTGEVLVLVPFVGLWAGIRSYHRGIGFLCGSAFCLACLVALMPWMGRNFLALGTLVPVTTGWAPTLERSLSELSAEETGPPRTDPGEDLAKKIAETGDETFAYQESLKAVWEKGGTLDGGNYLRLGFRGITFWFSDYVALLGPWLDPTSGFYMASRVFWMTFTILGLTVAALGVALSLGNANAWLLVGPLIFTTVFAALFNLPGYRHLAYWPLFSPFLAMGALTYFQWIRKFLTGAPRSPVHSERPAPIFHPKTETPPLFHQAPKEKETPVWPVEDNRSNLGPIGRRRGFTQMFKTNKPKEMETPIWPVEENRSRLEPIRRRRGLTQVLKDAIKPKEKQPPASPVEGNPSDIELIPKPHGFTQLLKALKPKAKEAPADPAEENRPKLEPIRRRRSITQMLNANKRKEE